MDYVERFEKRTVLTETETKLGATRVILRPSPLGFGLRCNPNVHQVLKAVGIEDYSVKVWGSRNQATFRMLELGNAPLAMGNGMGGKRRKLDGDSEIRERTPSNERGAGRCWTSRCIGCYHNTRFNEIMVFPKSFPGEKDNQFFRIRVVKQPPNLPQRIHNAERPLVSPYETTSAILFVESV